MMVETNTQLMKLKQIIMEMHVYLTYTFAL